MNQSEKKFEDWRESRARELVNATEIKKMEHCIGFEPKDAYWRNGRYYFKPYRNHFSPGGSDKDIWAELKKKGLADGGDTYYYVNRAGLAILSAIEHCYIYSDAASGNEVDASGDVIEVLLDDAVYCGHGCWLPSGAGDIARRARLPKKLTIETLKYLRDEKGYTKHVYEGGIDDEGFPHCTHGWILTQKWIDEHRDRYVARQQEEYKRMEEIEEQIRRDFDDN